MIYARLKLFLSSKNRYGSLVFKIATIERWFKWPSNQIRLAWGLWLNSHGSRDVMQDLKFLKKLSLKFVQKYAFEVLKTIHF
jgi:hypothetical protein